MNGRLVVQTLTARRKLRLALALGLALALAGGKGHAADWERALAEEYFSQPELIAEPPADWDASLEQAEALRDARQFAKAIALYQILLAERPADRSAREGLALTYTYSENYAASIALYEQLVTDYPQDLGLQRRLAEVYSWQGSYDRAIALYEGILAVAAEAIDVRLALAESLAWNGQHEAAIAAYDQVLATEPDNQKAWLARPQVAFWAGQPDRAIALYHAALEQYPNQPDLRLGLAQVYESQQQVSRAIAVLQPLLDSQHPEAIAIRDNIRAIKAVTDFRADGIGAQESSFGLNQGVRFRIDDGPTRQSVRVSYTTFTQQNLETLGNTTLEVGIEGRVNALNLSGTLGVDRFSRLPAIPRLGFSLSTPLATNLTFTGNLRYGAYRENVATLENQITAFQVEPTLYWQIDPKTSLFLFYKTGFYSDGNLEHQASLSLDRQFGNFFASAFVFYWSFANDPQTGYFAPPNFMLYSGELGWRGNLTEQLDCRLSASIESQVFADTSEGVNTYRASCGLAASPTLSFNFGYQYSTNAVFNAGNSSASQKIQGRLNFIF
jgi:tetratricopeptide (TPR) repeat protein